MQYAIELYFDKEIEHNLYELAKKIADEKIAQNFWNGRQDPILHWHALMM